MLQIKKYPNAIKKAIEKFGTVDVLVNNAGYRFHSALEEGNIQRCIKIV